MVASLPMKKLTCLLLCSALAACDGSSSEAGSSDSLATADSAATDAGSVDASDATAPGGDVAGAPDDAGAAVPDGAGDDAVALLDAASPDVATSDDATPAATPDAAPDGGAGDASDAGGGADVAPAGPAVGVALLTVETLAGRSLPTAVWYPALDDGTTAPEVYLGLLPGQALRDAPVAPGGPWPLIVFSHGSTAMKEQSIFLTEELTKHGYVVAAPDHIGNTFLTQSDEMMPVVARERPRDISAVIDRLQSPEPGDPAWFSTSIDFEHIGVAGHSFGGYTAIALGGGVLTVPQEVIDDCATKPGDLICSIIGEAGAGPFELRDERIDVAVAMTPGGYQAFREEGLAHVVIPTMVMAGLADDTTPYDTEVFPFYDGIPGTKYLWSLEHGVHFTWSDFCQIIPFIGEEMAANFGTEMCAADAPLPIEEAHALIFDMTLAMFDAWLLGDPEAVARLEPAWAEAQSPEVKMTVGP